MINSKRDYVILQSANIIFSLLSYVYIKDVLLYEQQRSIIEFLVLLSVVMSALYVFHTNRIFYKIIRDKWR